MKVHDLNFASFAPGTWLIRALAVAIASLLLAGCAGQPTESPAAREPVTDPAQALVYSRQGAAAHKQGNTTKAITAWQKAFELNPGDAATCNNLALLLKQRKRFSEAVTVLENGLRVSPGVPELHYNLAIISELYLLDLEQALDHYQSYQELSASSDKKVEGWIADLQRRLDQ